MAKKIVNKDIPVSCIKISPHHWEREHGTDDIKSLATSITERGQFHQVLVRPIGKSKQAFELITGKKRLIAVRATGERTIRCAVVNLSDEEAEIASLEENLLFTELPTRARDAAIKRLHDLYAPKVEEELRREQEQEVRNAEERRGVGKRNLGSQRTKTPGRPKTVTGQTVKKVAKKANISVARTRKALKREANLAPVVLRAFEQEKISVEQADILADLPIAEQREELTMMLKETQEASRERVSRTKLSTTQGDTAVAVRMLTKISLAAADMKTKVDEAMTFMNSTELDYDVLGRVDTTQIKSCQSTIAELIRSFLS